MSVRAFVAGATGYVGRELVRELRAKGAEVHAHVRPDSTSLERYRREFEGVGAICDTTEWVDDAMRAAFKDIQPTHVFALLGTTRARMSRAKKEGRDPALDSYERVDYGLTAMLFRSANSCESKPKFIYLSSAGVSDASTNPYLEVRARFERELKAGVLPYVIAHPSFITGPDREETRTTERVSAAAADAVLNLIGVFGGKSFRDRYASMNAATLARGLARAALDERVVNTTLDAEALR